MAVVDEVMRAQEEVGLVASALADPLRCKILSRVAERAFTVPSGEGSVEWDGVTVRGLAERLGESPRKVRYHMDALCEQGLLEVKTRKKRRGVIERHFTTRHVPILDERDVAVLPPAEQKKIFLGCLGLIFADAKASIETGAAVRRPDWAASRATGDVDEQGRRELAKIHADSVSAAREAIARARRRMETSTEAPIAVVSASLFFEAAPSEQPRPADRGQ